jgi:DNA primase
MSSQQKRRYSFTLPTGPVSAQELPSDIKNPALSGMRYRILGKRQPLWPMYWLKHVYLEGDYIVITEGAWSAMHIYQHSGLLPLALMGAKAGTEILDILAPFRPIFLYDGDQAGRNACKKMRSLGAEHSYVLPVSPDDMGISQLEELTKKLEKICKD